MKLNNKIKLIVSGLMLVPFIIFGRINAMEHLYASKINLYEPEKVLFTCDEGELDPNCWLEVNYETIDDVEGIVLNCVFPKKYDKNVTCNNYSDFDVYAYNYSNEVLCEDHYILKKYINLHCRENSIDDFKFIIYDSNDQRVATKKIIYHSYTFSHDPDVSYLHILSTLFELSEKNVNHLLHINPGVYNIYLNSGDETLGVFKNVVIKK